MTGRTVHLLDGRGFVRDWLAGPAWSHPCDDLDAVLSPTGSPWGPPATSRWVLTNAPDVAPLKSRIYDLHPLVTEQAVPGADGIVEGGPIEWRSPWGSSDSGEWCRAHTGWDGYVDWSQFCFTPEYRHAVAATVLEVDQAEWRTLEVACTGPIAVWIGGELAGVFTDIAYMEAIPHRVRVRLESGLTPVVLATWQVAFREVRHVASMRVLGLPVRVVIPSPGADEYAAAAAEALLDAVATERWAVDDGHAVLTGPAGLALTVAVGRGAPRPVRLDGPGLDGPGYSTTEPRRRVAGGISIRAPQAPPYSMTALRSPRVETTGSARVPLVHDESVTGSASMLITGESQLHVRVDDPRCPVVRTLDVCSLPPRQRTAPSGDPAEWRRELLDHVAAAWPSSARALARATLDPDAKLDEADLEGPLRMIDSRADCADFEVLGLVHLLARIPVDRWPPAALGRVRSSLLAFRYWIDQPGLDAMCFFTENHQFVWHTAELLVGERLAGETFVNAGWTGADHAAHGRGLAVEWMRRKLAGGFSEFDSNAYLAIDSLALCSLVEYAGDAEVRQLAEALLDKILLTLAANSWRGVHGAAHGRSYVPTLRSSRLEETAPIMWTVWGLGALNNALLPATVLATARCYRVPAVVRAVATELPDEWDGRQVYRGGYRLHHDLLARPYGSDLRVWRTPDAMLASVQDYRAGLPGLQEHIWGATLGSEVQVFATHPAADSISSSARPNAWAGQRVLPRVRQHRASLLVLHRLADDDPAGHTHLWFPAPLMDETAQRGPWLAGRVGDGYVAVAADGGFDPITTGDEANQAWLPRGDGRAYVATVGRAAVHGPFAAFVEALAEPVFGSDHRGEPTVRWVDLEGHPLALSWSGPFLAEGDGLAPPPHLANPAVTVGFDDTVLRAEWVGEVLELDLAAGRRLVPPSGVPT